jgi:hypothetical protein
MRFVRLLCVALFAAFGCGDVKATKPPADAAQQSAGVCKFDVDKFSAECVLAP